ncbi:hypothetical protein [Streptomyces rochei]|uniref:hypothetical protein n=1 Tax=Streptomyces rochei TaxID=1928 RepID=UPI0036FFF0E1
MTGTSRGVPTLLLYCEIVTDRGELYYVQVPVAPELWESHGEVFRDRLRQRARAELRHAVTSRGRSPLAGRSFDDAPVWVEQPGECTVECVGGPLDGMRITTQGSEPPPGLRLVAPVDWTAVRDEDALPVPQVSTYSLMTTEHGHFARSAVDGAWRYEFRR